MTLTSLMTRGLTTGALLLAGAGGHAALTSEIADAQRSKAAVSITLKDTKGATYAYAQGTDLGRYRYRLAARIRRPILSGAYVLRFQSRNSTGRRTTNLVYDIRARPR